MSSPERLSLASRKQHLQDLARRYPDAYFSALQKTGIPIPIPEGIDLPHHNTADARRTFLELIVPDDIWPALHAWDCGRKVGAASARLRLASDPEHFVEVHILDFTDEHGVLLELVVTEDGANPWHGVAPAPNARARVGTMRKDEHAFISSIDAAATDLLGWQPEDMVGHRTLEFIDPEHAGLAITTFVDMLRNPGCARRCRVRYRRADGSWLWVEATNHNLLADPRHGYVLTEILDVSEEMAYQEALRSREELLRRLTDALPLGVLHVDLDGRVLYRNERLGTMFGRTDATTLQEEFASANPELFQDLLDGVRTQARDADVDIVVDTALGPRHCKLALRALKDATGMATGAVIAVEDVTDSIRMREELERRATIDSLTGCHTRSSIMARLDTSLSDGRVRKTGTGVIFIDLDQFKTVNDDYGHAVGDAYLAEVASRLLGAIREHDAVGRLGGDEFLILCDGVTREEQLSDIAHRVSACLAEAVDLTEAELPVYASIGIAWSERSICRPDDLVALADDAMYAVKRVRRAPADGGSAPTTSSVVRVS